MKPRSLPQNRKLSAMVDDVQRVYPLLPWKHAMAREAWRRYFIAEWVHEARMEAYGAGLPDPFPVRPVPSSSLSSEEMNELLECTLWLCCTRLNLIFD